MPRRFRKPAFRRPGFLGPARPAESPVPPSRLAARDLLQEALAGVLQRPARSVLTSIGTVLGVGSLVAILGLTSTASWQIDDRFNSLTATEVSVEDTGGGDAEQVALSFPPDAAARVRRLNGVREAGVYWTVLLNGPSTVRSMPEQPGEADGEQAQIVAASPGVLRAAVPHLAHGRLFDEFHQKHAQPVAVIGSGLAARLGISTLRTNPAVFLDGRPFTVLGIMDDVERKPDLLLSVVIPRNTAEAIWGGPQKGERAKMLVSTDLGAAPQVAGEVAVALDPAHPGRFKAIPPPDPRTLRAGVTSDLNQLFLLLAGVCLLIGMVGIANTTLVAVMERTPEIGLRRATGAGRSHITLQFLAESGMLGSAGGLVGSCLGTLSVVAIAIARGWYPVLSPVTVTLAPVLGLAAGLLAGLYPSWRASRIEPAEALRR